MRHWPRQPARGPKPGRTPKQARLPLVLDRHQACDHGTECGVGCGAGHRPGSDGLGRPYGPDLDGRYGVRDRGRHRSRYRVRSRDGYRRRGRAESGVLGFAGHQVEHQVEDGVLPVARLGTRTGLCVGTHARAPSGPRFLAAVHRLTFHPVLLLRPPELSDTVDFIPASVMSVLSREKSLPGLWAGVAVGLCAPPALGPLEGLDIAPVLLGPSGPGPFA